MLAGRSAGDNISVSHLDGANGTFIDGKRIAQPQLLKPGNVLRVGNSHLRLETGFFPEQTPAPTPEQAVKSEGSGVMKAVSGSSTKLSPEAGKAEDQLHGFRRAGVRAVSSRQTSGPRANRCGLFGNQHQNGTGGCLEGAGLGISGFECRVESFRAGTQAVCRTSTIPISSHSSAYGKVGMATAGSAANMSMGKSVEEHDRQNSRRGETELDTCKHASRFTWPVP